MAKSWFEQKHRFSVDRISPQVILLIVQNGGSIGPRVCYEYNGNVVSNGFQGIYPDNTVEGNETVADGVWMLHEMLIAGFFRVWVAEHVLSKQTSLVLDEGDLNAL